MDLAKLAASSAPITLTSNSGETITLQMSPLTDKQLGQLDNWVKEQSLATMHLALKDASAETRKEIITESMRKADGVHAFSAEGIRFLATIRGLQFILWLSCVPNHPTLKVEDLSKYIFSDRNANKESLAAVNTQNVNRLFEELNKVPGVTPKVDPAKSLKARKKNLAAKQTRPTK